MTHLTNKQIEEAARRFIDPDDTRLVTRQEHEAICRAFLQARSQRAAVVEECQQIAWDEAERQLALYDEGKTTYGHHAAENIAKAIRSKSDTPV